MAKDEKKLTLEEQMGVLQHQMAQLAAENTAKDGVIQKLQGQLASGGNGSNFTCSVKSRTKIDEKGNTGKGTVNVYGLQRWPVSLYASQWARILHPTNARKLADFIRSAPDEAGDNGEFAPAYKDDSPRTTVVKDLTYFLAVLEAGETVIGSAEDFHSADSADDTDAENGDGQQPAAASA